MTLRSEFTRSDNGCWNWNGAKNHKGYGRKFFSGKNKYAHRVYFQIMRGSIPKGFQLDHLCRNRSCVNPDHLEIVTNETNYLRGNGYKYTHEELKEFYSRWKNGETQKCIAKTLNLTQTTVFAFLKRYEKGLP